jgi:uncharacterized repeat protein (TIGR01451 family)
MHKQITKWFWVFIFTCVLVMPIHVLAQPAFTKSFSPDTIGPGSVSTLTFTITNAESTPITDLAFTDALPAGLTIANPSNAISDCTGADGTLSAPAGGSVISLTGGAIGGNTTCTIIVDVTGSIPGTHTSISGDLTSDAGNSGPATDDLTVSTSNPGFTKAFAPASVPIGSRSTLTFTIDNTANPSAATYLSFTDNLPVGMVIADPSNASTTCPGGILTAISGSNTVVFTSDYSLLNAGTDCTVSVDVLATGSGLLGNSTDELFSGSDPSISSGKANATLEVTSDPLSLSKSFTDDPVPPGGEVTLEFTITNRDRDSSITDISFTDDLDASLTGLIATGWPTDPCGAGSTLTGTDVLTLSGGTLAPEASCTFSATLQVPAGAVPGAYDNSTSAVTGDGITGNAASDTLFVHPAPLLIKEFTDDPVAAGGDVTLSFTITNTSTTSAATDIAFIDELTTFLPFPVSVGLPPAPDPPCGAGSSMSLVSLGTDRQGLSLTGASLAAGGSCTFDVTVTIPAALAAGTYTSTTEVITATIDNVTYTGSKAADNLLVVAGPTIIKSFTDDPVSAGDTVTLEYTLEHSSEVPGNAADISFTDDLTSALAGLTATGWPTDPCGAGSTLTGTNMLTLSGGSLTPGETCTFSVTLQTPTDAVLGDHTSTTSDVTSTVSGLNVTSPASSDDLTIASIDFTSEFIDDPVIPGDTATLRFTLDNVSAYDATNIIYTYDLNSTLSDLIVDGPLPSDPCGAGSSLSLIGTTFLFFTGGNLTAGTDCTFDVTVRVPAGAGSGTYNSTTSSLSATLDGSPFILAPATDALTVQTEWLELTKVFTEDSVKPGGTADLTFTLTNLHPVEAASNIAFTDNLDAALSGLVATGLPVVDICETGSSLSGTNTLTFTGGVLGAGASCEFTVTVAIPEGTSPVTLINTTSQVTGIINSLAVTGFPASDEISVESVNFSETFNQLSPTPAGETVTLSITIENLDAALPVSGIAFTNNLGNTLSGLVAEGLPQYDICGTGSVLSGTSFLTLSGGSLDAGASCTFDIQLSVPDTATSGVYLNTTSDLTSNGIVVSSAASATMEVFQGSDNIDGSSGICFINAVDTGIVVPFGWIAGFAIIMIVFIGIYQTRRKSEIS